MPTTSSRTNPLDNEIKTREHNKQDATENRISFFPKRLGHESIWSAHSEEARSGSFARDSIEGNQGRAAVPTTTGLPHDLAKDNGGRRRDHVGARKTAAAHCLPPAQMQQEKEWMFSFLLSMESGMMERARRQRRRGLSVRRRETQRHGPMPGYVGASGRGEVTGTHREFFAAPASRGAECARVCGEGRQKRTPVTTLGRLQFAYAKM